MFEYLAEQNPGELLRLITEGSLEYYDLTFAAEIAGRLGDSEAVRSALVPLLQHEEAVVREGAIYGLSAHMSEDVVRIFIGLVDSEPSPGVRKALTRTLEGWNRGPAAKG